MTLQTSSFFPPCRATRCQDGHALIEFAPFLVIMMVFLVFIADVNQYIYLRLCVDNAAYCASQQLAENTALSKTDLTQIALNTSPALASGELSVTLYVSELIDAPYVHHLPESSSPGSFRERVSNAAYRVVRVSIQFSYRATTPFARLLATQANNTIELAAQYEQVADGILDEHTEASVW